MTSCGLCDAKDFKVIYHDFIRDGVFGKVSSSKHKVVKCSGCGLVRLLNNPLNMAYYQSEEYRNFYNNSSNISDYIKVHDDEQPPRLAKLGSSFFRDKIVLDFGCGGGAFLDLTSGIAAKTIGIEPFEGYHQSLKNRNHQIFSNSKQAKKEYANKIDAIVSFGVLEHVENPQDYLKDAFELLKKGGKMYIETDNLDDILMKLEISSFHSFFYRTAHLWYFDSNTLEALVKKTGFSDIKMSFRHNFDLSNTFLWLRDNKPTGIKKVALLNKKIEVLG